MSRKDRRVDNLSLEWLRSVLAYSPDQPNFVRKVDRGHFKAGTIAGTVRPDGYIHILLGQGADRSNYKSYLGHRLAWFYVHGVWPDQLDHINGDKADNSLSNLRPATSGQNNQNLKRAKRNNQAGYLGVFLDKRTGLYVAVLQAENRKHRLYDFRTSQEAYAAYLDMKLKYHPYQTISTSSVTKETL